MESEEVKKQVLTNMKGIAEIMRKDYPAITGILYAVCGAIHANKEIELLHYLSDFAEKQTGALNNIKAQRN